MKKNIKVCSKCKKEKEELEFGKDKYRYDGLCSCCKDCKYRNPSNKKEYYLKNRERILQNQKRLNILKKEKIKKYMDTYSLQYHIRNKNEPIYIFKQYKADAKRRGISFNLNIEDFIKLNDICEYCGIKLDKIRIDRINNNIGYIINNCVPCCNICNITKKTLTLDEWKVFLNQLISFQKFGKINTIKQKDCRKQFSSYKFNSKRKRIIFDISFDQFELLINNTCYYCGSDMFIGIDRINNSIGYVIGNCVSCCKICNYGKNKNSIIVWEDWIKRITNFKKGVK